MKKIVFLLNLILIVSVLMAQDAYIYKLPSGIVPVIDGSVDQIWESIDPNYIEKPYRTDIQPTIVAGTLWKAAWNDTAVFVIVVVKDDVYCDKWCSGLADWQSDKPEIYLDLNDILKDGLGPSTMYTGMGTGHYQFAPGPDSSFQGWSNKWNSF